MEPPGGCFKTSQTKGSGFWYPAQLIETQISSRGSTSRHLTAPHTLPSAPLLGGAPPQQLSCSRPHPCVECTLPADLAHLKATFQSAAGSPGRYFQNCPTSNTPFNHR